MHRKQRTIDPSKSGTAHDAALRKVMERGGKKQDTEVLRERLKPIYKSVDRKLEKDVKKGGSSAVKNIKGKINYFKHLDDRASRRGEER